MLYFLFRNVCYFLLAYIYGLYYLVVQLFRRLKTTSGIPLQTGKVAIVTGGASGIGFCISRGLVAKNVHVVIGCQTATEGKHTIDRIREEFPNAKVDFIQLNLSSLRSVKEFAEEFLARNLGLHILVNNAGVMFPPYSETEDGIERTFQVNYLSHFYLTQLLLDRLKRSGADNSVSRIVNVSSALQSLGSPDVDNIGNRYDHWYQYSPHKSYADSKLMIVAASNYLNSVLQKRHFKVVVNSLHPGIVESNLIRHLHWLLKPVIAIVGRMLYLSPAQGAYCPLHVALSPDLEGEGGSYYDNSQEVWPATIATDRTFQECLWINSQQLIDKHVL